MSDIVGGSGGGGGISPDGMADETSNRTTGTWYENTTGVPLLIATTTNRGTETDVHGRMHLNDTQTDRVVIESVATRRVSFTLIVPAGHYYKMTTGFGGNEVYNWYEQKLQ